MLRALAAAPALWRHGYDLGAETGLKAGSLYPILARLADRGFLEARWEEAPSPGRPGRHLYRLTPDGLEIAAADAARAREAAAAGASLPARAPRARARSHGEDSPAGRCVMTGNQPGSQPGGRTARLVSQTMAGRLLAVATAVMPASRRDWGKALSAGLAHTSSRRDQVRLVFAGVRVALLQPGLTGYWRSASRSAGLAAIAYVPLGLLLYLTNVVVPSRQDNTLVVLAGDGYVLLALMAAGVLARHGLQRRGAALIAGVAAGPGAGRSGHGHLRGHRQRLPLHRQSPAGQDRRLPGKRPDLDARLYQR